MPFEHLDSERTASSKHSYHYTTIVKFASGRTVEVPAGYTTFLPISVPSVSRAAEPFTTNLTLLEGPRCQSRSCYNDSASLQCIAHVQTTTFGAEVVLDGGYAIRQGE